MRRARPCSLSTELAHRLGRTNDWVVIHFHEDHSPEGQATIVTEQRERLRGRVVRGRERECAELADADPDSREPRRAFQDSAA